MTNPESETAVDSVRTPRNASSLPPERRLARLYLFVLVTMALLSAASPLAIQIGLANGFNDARILNQISRQRMLSQRISKIALQLAVTERAAERSPLLSELRSVTRNFAAAHAVLLDASTTDVLSGREHNIQQLLLDIDPALQTIVTASETMVSRGTTLSPSEAEQFARQILSAEPDFLIGMERVVLASEDESRDSVERLRAIAFALFIASLGVLWLEGRFIFGPAVRRVEATLMALRRQVTERQQLTEELSAARSRQEALMNSTNDLIWSVDRDYRLLTANHAFRTFSRHALVEQLKPEDDTAAHGDLARIFHQFYDRALNNTYFTEELRVGAITLELTFAPISNDEREIVGVSVFARDVTARKHAEEQMRQLNQRLLFHVQRTPLGYVEWGNDARVAAWNPAAERIFGYTADEVLGQRIIDKIVPARLHNDIENLRQQLSDNREVSRTNANRTRQGTEIICDWYNTPLVDAEGTVTGWAALVQDVTARVQAEQDLFRLNHALQRRVDELFAFNQIAQTLATRAGLDEMLHDTVEQVADLFGARCIMIGLIDPLLQEVQIGAFYDVEDEIEPLVGQRFPVGALPALEQMSAQRTPVQAADAAVLELFGPIGPLMARHGRFAALFTPVAAGEHNVGFMVVTTDRAGDTFREAEVQLAQTVAGQIAGAIERAHLFEEARQARAAAEAASQAKSRFLAAMSHELRTPLNGILGYAQLLQNDPQLSGQQRESIATITRSGEHLLTLVNDVLDLARVETGKIELYTENFVLPMFLSGLGAMVQAWAAQKGLRFNLVQPEQLPQTVHGDARRLRQILLNLLGNAIKFTDQGSVTLRVERLPDRAEQEILLRIAVEDSGVGISPEDIANIFQPFQQGGDFSRRAAGTGLGLTISSELLRLMRSELHVTSVLGEGSSFWFELALPAVDSPASSTNAVQRPVGYEGESRHILIADPDPLSRMMLVALLRGVGFQVSESADAPNAFRLLQQQPCDLLIASATLLRISGSDLARAMNAVADRRALPVIALSAGNASEDRTLQADRRITEVMSRPVDSERMLAAVQQVLQVTWRYPEVAAATEPRDEMRLPPDEELEELRRLVQVGDIRTLRRRADELAEKHPQHADFARELSQFARTFQLDKIRALLRVEATPTTT